MEELKKIINEVLENRNRIPLKNILETTKLRDDLGFDSLDLAELTVKIEAKFDIDVFEDGIITTVGEIIGKLKK